MRWRTEEKSGGGGKVDLCLVEYSPYWFSIIRYSFYTFLFFFNSRAKDNLLKDITPLCFHFTWNSHFSCGWSHWLLLSNSIMSNANGLSLWPSKSRFSSSPFHSFRSFFFHFLHCWIRCPGMDLYNDQLDVDSNICYYIIFIAVARIFTIFCCCCCIVFNIPLFASDFALYRLNISTNTSVWRFSMRRIVILPSLPAHRRSNARVGVTSSGYCSSFCTYHIHRHMTCI